MKNIKNFKNFINENYQPINEGGGAGIDFISSDVSFDIQYTYHKGILTLVKKEYGDLEQFDAEGYQDGMREVKGDLLKVDTDNATLKAELIADITVADIRYSAGNDAYAEYSPETTLKEISMGQSVSVDINGSAVFSNMLFAGYVRGTIEEGTVIFNSNDGEYDDHTNIYFDNEEYIPKNDFSNSDKNIDIKILDSVMPTYKATEEFVYFYNDTFDNDIEDEDEDEMHRRDLKDMYGA